MQLGVGVAGGVGAMGPGMPGAVGGPHGTQAIYTRGSQHANKQAAAAKPKTKLTQAQRS